jgi:hypothetical protein
VATLSGAVVGTVSIQKKSDTTTELNRLSGDYCSLLVQVQNVKLQNAKVQKV